MTDRMRRGPKLHDKIPLRGNQSGFTLAEFLIAALVTIVACAAIFGALVQIQQTAGYQIEVQAVLNNTQIAMETVQRYIRQAGNDPLGCGVTAITIVGPEELRVQSDLTGSAGPASPDKGDPDGDIADSAENVSIRYNSRSRSLEIVPPGGPAQIVASYISGVVFQYYDAAGGAAVPGAAVRKVGITISGSSLLPDPQTHRIFGVQLNSEIQVPS